VSRAVVSLDGGGDDVHAGGDTVEEDEVADGTAAIVGMGGDLVGVVVGMEVVG